MSGKTTQSTSTTQIPASVLARYDSVNSTAEAAASTPYQKYSDDPNAFVAPINAQQTAGINATNYYANAAQPAISTGEALTMAGAQAVDPTKLDSAAISQYENPYTAYVTDQTSKLMQQQSQQAQASQLGNAIKSGSFGGDRSGIAAANLAGQQSLAYGNAMAPILQQGYNTALATAQQQQGVGLAAGQANQARLLTAGNQVANLGVAGQTAGLAGAAQQTAAGTLEQQTEQAGKTALYNQFEAEQSYPFQVSQFLTNAAEGTGSLSGSTTSTSTSSPYFSDRRLKENLKRVGTAKNGLPIYSFNYKDDPEKITRLGFMADEVEKKHPEAVGLAGGYKTVDYDAAARPVRYAGGLVADSSEGRGFEAGGLADLVAQQKAMYSPQTGGLGASRTSGSPHGGKSYVPASTSTSHQMLQPVKPVTAPQASGLAQLAQIGQQINSLKNTGTGLSGAYNDLKNKLTSVNEAPAVSAAAAAPAAVQPSDVAPTANSRGGLNFASGGATDSGSPEGLYSTSGSLDIPNESPHYQLGQSSSNSGSGSGSSGLSQIAGIGSAVSGLGSLGSSALSGLSGLAALFTLARGGAAKDGGLTGENFDFARGGLADGGLPSDDDSLAAQDALDSARQFSGGLNPRADLESAHHMQSSAPAPTAEEPHKSEGLLGLRAAAKDLTDQGYFDPKVNADRANFGSLPDKAPDQSTRPPESGLAAAAAEPDVPLPPRRPAGLGAQPEQQEPSEATPRPGLAPQPEANPVVRAGNAVSAGLTGAVEGAGRAVQSGIHAILGHEEGFRSTPYNDGGVLAIGYGSHTIMGADGRMRPVQPGDRLSQPQAVQQMDARLHNEFIPQAQKQIGAAWNGLSQRAQDGIASVTWNYGHVPASVVAAARSGDDRQIAAAIAALPANPGRRQREAAYVAGQDVYGKGGPDPRSFQANAAPSQDGGSSSPGGLAGFGASLDNAGKTLAGAGEGAGDWFEGNKNWMIPLLTGLGTMASSNSRYLGSAILQGMGGGAQAYAQQQASQADIGEKQAHTQLTVAEAARTNAVTEAQLLENFQHTSFKDRATGEPKKTIIMPDGTRRNVTFAEYKTLVSSGQQVRDANPATDFQPGQAAPVPTGAPALGAAPIAAVPGAPTNAPGASAPVGGAFAPAPAGAPQTHIPAPPVPPAPVGVGFGQVSQGYAARENRWDPYNQAGVAQGDEDAIKVQKEAEAARGQVQYAQKLMNTVADASQGKLGNVAGAGANDRAQLINLGNTAANAFGLGPNYFGDLPDQATIMNKLNTLRATAQAHGGNLEAYAALEALKNANPSIEMPREAMASLTAQVLADQQRVLDRADHMERYKQSGAESTAYAAKAFNEENGSGKYNREAAALQKLILSQPKVLHTLTSGKYKDKAHIEEYLQKKLGAPPGLSRYFVSGGG